MSARPARASRDPAAAIREAAADWALRLEEGGLDAHERQAFEAWRDSDAAHAAAFGKAQRLLGDARGALAADPELTKRLIGARGGAGTRLLTLLLVTLAALMFALTELPERGGAGTVTTSSHDELLTVPLPDGSRVLLDGKSTLVERFDGETRRVELLRGAAWFEVAADPARPFVVEAGVGEVRALGTAFAIDRAGGGAEVTVLEHSIAISAAGAEQTVVLEAGERVAYDTEGRLGPVEQVTEAAAAAWRRDRLDFQDEPVALVLERLGRRLPGRLLVLDIRHGERRISGSFDLADPDAALASFSRTFGLGVMRAGPWLTLVY